MKRPVAGHRMVLLVLLGWSAAGALKAADVPWPARDPMQPPPHVQAAAPATNPGAVPVTRTDAIPRHVMVIEGRRYVVERGRRLSVGDMLGDARIERIDDGAVWLREDGVVQQVSLFGGIVKRIVPASDAAASRPAAALPPHPKTSPTGK